MIVMQSLSRPWPRAALASLSWCIWTITASSAASMIQRRWRIQMEALACQEVFARAARSDITLAWSFMHEDETILCPFPARRQEAFRLATLCQVRVAPVEAIRALAQSFQARAGLSAKDALHLACAAQIGVVYLVRSSSVRRSSGAADLLAG